MKDQDYIRTAVELADGWDSPIGRSTAETLSQADLDALAAQLVRQVDESDGCFCDSRCSKDARVWVNGSGYITHIEGDDRTMNTIKAIVDSKVLK